MASPNTEAPATFQVGPGLDTDDKFSLGWEIGKRYRIWTQTVDLVLGYKNGWVVVQDVATGEVRSHLTTMDHTDRLLP